MPRTLIVILAGLALAVPLFGGTGLAQLQVPDVAGPARDLPGQVSVRLDKTLELTDQEITRNAQRLLRARDRACCGGIVRQSNATQMVIWHVEASWSRWNLASKQERH